MNQNMHPTPYFAFLWVGAAVSLAEIMTGTYFAGLGWQQGLLAIVLGHLIGGVLFFLAGYIGATRQQSAMETVKNSFGQRGGLLFALLNVVQLFGWTAIMIYDGALAANGIWSLGQAFWCALIGGLIVLWLWIGQGYLQQINRLAVLGLFSLTLILSWRLFGNATQNAVGDALPFGAAVELAAVMPLSWLPLVSDYTRHAAKPLRATLTSTIAYGIMSVWMYAIGLGMALYAQETDFAKLLLGLGLGTLSLLMIVFSTVTTTFLDAYSAGVSGVSLYKRLPEKGFAIAVTLICTLAAIVFPMTNITEFLYFIGSVFAPMIAVQIADVFILHKTACKRGFNWLNLGVWFAGFLLYRYLLVHPLPMGNTLPVMVATLLICCVAHAVLGRKVVG